MAPQCLALAVAVREGSCPADQKAKHSQENTAGAADESWHRIGSLSLSTLPTSIVTMEIIERNMELILVSPESMYMYQYT